MVVRPSAQAARFHRGNRLRARTASKSHPGQCIRMPTRAEDFIHNVTCNLRSEGLLALGGSKERACQIPIILVNCSLRASARVIGNMHCARGHKRHITRGFALSIHGVVPMACSMMRNIEERISDCCLQQRIAPMIAGNSKDDEGHIPSVA